MDWANLDLRIVAVILVVLSFLGGVYIPFLPLLVISNILVFTGIGILALTPKGAPGTSGYLGLLILVIAGCAVLIIPAWIGYGIKLIVR